MPDSWFKNRLHRWSGYGLSWSLRCLQASLDIRSTHFDRSTDPSRPEFSGKGVYVFWHEYLAFPLGLMGHYNVTMLASQHRDADWLINAADRLGFGVVRGSTNRGGSQAVRELKRRAHHGSIAITPDGPRGPRREMALGAIFLASRLELPIIPVGFGYDSPFRFKTWDAFAVPRPMSRARIIMGPRIGIPRKAGREELEDYRLKIQSLLDTLTASAEDWASSTFRMKHEIPFRRHRGRQSMTEEATLKLMPMDSASEEKSVRRRIA
ncbi:MAG: lysophospholipid acyltransferase family protein [Planctomycetota bacterium]|nr:lysophospholipid acyltransferase family protein [Planctomycetota bacterium]MEC8432244.1 lysophospholipid acyltransferase family protein [Planctomycetota bacterium]